MILEYNRFRLVIGSKILPTKRIITHRISCYWFLFFRIIITKKEFYAKG